MLNKLKKPSSIIIILIIVALAAGGYFYFTKKPVSLYEFTPVVLGNVIQEVSVTGKVKAAERVELSFEKSGKIISAGSKVGSRVKAGQTLASLENSDINGQLLQARAGVQVQQSKLDELKKGTRLEEILAAQITVANAQKSLDDAKISLENTRNSAIANLNSSYDSALTSAAKSISIALNSLYVLTDIQYDHFGGTDQNSMQVETAKANAVFSLLGAANAGRATKSALSSLNGGAKISVQTAQLYPTPENIEKALADTISALQAVKSALIAVPIVSELSSTDTTNLSTEKSNINTDIITISGKQQSISIQKTTNSSSVSTAEAAVNSAQNTLSSAQASLAIKQASATPEQITSQEAQVTQAIGNLRNIQSQFEKTIIRSPVDGILTQQDAKKGEMATPNKTIISIISDAKFEIEANVPEADIAKVAVENPTAVTLDAYASDIIFSAKVISIEPAETIIEGVATYKTKFQFLSEDERIKSGMTANIEILTNKREGVLVIPQRAIIVKNNEKYVLLDVNKESPEEVKIETGLRGSDGMVEVISGLKENDRIVSIGSANPK